MKPSKPVYERILAIIIMCIPGASAAYSWKWMRDIFHDFLSGQPFAWLPFTGSLILFLASIAFLGGFIFHHDKKRNRLKSQKGKISS
ncbi:DUF2627 domain-containing protein [Thermoactinomyces intermedius]|jgi:F0F1-type ATP synthase assembly protein I|uniref:DUF2627 domain-containing protein n=1 Tax=Thermoactinomyces intermedius TaxID=2024 RepID=A0A8I1A414_THEIN|nr:MULTISPECIES: DUF2627 domain-containing protein [Thermoactinomyces]MBA4548531.1 DUF2627 domain-containing protein [Thermoactinomyces intermedius]MBA4835829.1 DUF2627 domain-containing protein [Thermoactinomyces intermedius]MBH8594409.1 DUF2627 domain-containing protein [Thermoactinomyces intermedius]MBH8601686.1 DUF2627 domain-containing protein [Thermoactinomyces sp. CICC 23799]